MAEAPDGNSAEIRRQDSIEAGQEFEVERIDRGEYRLI